MRFMLFHSFFGVVLLAAGFAHGQSDRGATSANGLMSTCKNYTVPITNDDVDLPNIQAEFGGLVAGQFQQKLRQQLNAAPLNKVFPNARFFARSFEHWVVGYLYDRVVLQADILALSYLIRLKQSTNVQIRNDAFAALAFIHFQMDNSADNQRGLEYIQTAIKGLNSYPAVVFWGRSLVWGETYSVKNLNTAMNFLAAAGRLPQERQEQNVRIDPLHTLEVHTQTLMHLMANVPDMPYRDIYEPVFEQGMAITRIQEDYKQQYAKSNDFRAVTQVLQEFDTLLGSPEMAQAFEQSKTSSTTPGWDKLIATLGHQEQVAQRIHGPDTLNTAQKGMLVKLETLNQKLQTALVQSQRGLVFQLMNSKEEFPQKIKAVKSVSLIENSLSRSCSLSATWQARGV